MPVRTVPLARIKAKKIPIVQPNLTFRGEKNRQKNFIDIFQQDIEEKKARLCLLVNGIFLVL